MILRTIGFLLAGLLLAGGDAVSAGPADLATATVEYQEVPRVFRLDGVVEAIHQTTVSAQTQGQVQKILFDVDDYVDKGAVIVELKDTEQRARVTRAAADLRGAVAKLNQARDEHKRVREMFSKKLASASGMDQAEAKLKSARAAFEAAQASLVQAEEQLRYTRVRAPYSGIVTERHVQVGEAARPGQPLMSGISLDRLRVTVDVPQSLIPAIRKIGRARVRIPDDGWVAARKITIFPFADLRSNTFKVRLDLTEGTRDLFPGMFVKTAFVTGVKRELLVPAAAVVYRSEVTGVYVIDAEGGLHFRHVRVGRALDDGLVVLAGLTAGERVALEPVAAGTRLKQQRSEARGHG